MTTRTAAEIAAIDHLITKLGKDIVDATRVAEQQEGASEGAAKYSRRLGHEESAEFHRALAALLSDVVETVKERLSDADPEPNSCAAGRDSPDLGCGLTTTPRTPAHATTRRRPDMNDSPETDCNTYGCDWQPADCDRCGSPECYVVCENCGDEERQCEMDGGED